MILHILHTKSNHGLIFVSAGLMAVSTSLVLARYFVLEVEKTDLHQCVESNKSRTLIAESDSTGYSALRPR